MAKVDRKFDQTTRMLVENLKIARMALIRHLGDGSKIHGLSAETIGSLKTEVSDLSGDVHRLFAKSSLKTEALLSPPGAPPVPDQGRPQ